jgi:hypothetical protein
MQKGNRLHVTWVSRLCVDVSVNCANIDFLIYATHNFRVEYIIINKEGSDQNYPVSFHNTRIKDGYMCYNVKAGRGGCEPNLT